MQQFQMHTSTLRKSFNVLIEQKYLVSGHTQMECDSMHSMIEKRMHGPMYAPQDYMVVMRAARHANPYTVTEVKFNDFKMGCEDNTSHPSGLEKKLVMQL